jgi:predicted dehydrogenase
MLNICMVGHGMMGVWHSEALQRVDDAQLHTVVGRKPAPAGEAQAAPSGGRKPPSTEEFATKYGYKKWTTDLGDALADPEVDIVIIAGPSETHADMAIAALEAGKHVWCEKPMAGSLADAERMLAAARASGRTTVLGYNFIQNPAFRLMRKLLGEERIGAVNHIRIEMDEDFMADPEALFYWKSEAASGHGALDDFGVHPLSLISVLFGGVRRVCGQMAKPYADRPLAGGRRSVETYDIASALVELETGASGVICLNRSAWGRKGRISVQLYGATGTILYDQERMNELQLYTADMPPETQGFRTILTAPHHPPYDRFIPAPGHGLGFNDLKVIECRALIGRIRGEATRIVDFEEGIRIERTVDAIARSAHAGTWMDVPGPEVRAT